ncbi:MAG: TonB-dependent receptor [Chitinophagaceae bacterium]|nr:TonB-dependent receptor [Chitinophagaceae bacterium]MCB9045906.1 TonB-dependent receptor [Chitinophagales bacterium]
MKYVLLLVLLYTVVPAHAQQDCKLNINVLVVEKHTGQPLFPVVVHIDELNATYETNEKGRVELGSICPGKYNFHFHSDGYEHYAEQVTITSSTELKFKLSHIEGVLDEVTIADAREQTLLQAKDGMDSKQIAANSGKSLGDMLQAVNGVTVISNGATIAKPVIHGMHSNRIVMLNNGVRQEDQQWGGEHAPNIDPFLANSLEVIKGAASVKYGTDAIGGVILVEPAPLRATQGTDAELNLAGLSNNRMGVASAMVNHNFKKLTPLSIRLQGTYKKGGNYRIPGYWVANTGVEENNYSAAAAWRKQHYGAEVFYSHFNTNLGVYRGSHTGNEADKLAAVNSDTPLVPADFTYELKRPRQHVEHDLGKAKMYLESSLGTWHATYAYQQNFRQEYDVQRVETDRAQLNLTLNTQTFNLNLEHRQIWKLKGEAGFDGIYQENFIQNGDRVFLPNYRSKGAAAYLIERYRAHDWTFEGGLRYDYRWYEAFNPEGSKQQVVRYEYHFNNLSGTFGATKKLSDKWQLSTILSNAWRAPQANELFSAGLHQGAARIELGNKNLQPERSYNLNIESKNTLGKKLSTEISLYTQYIQNYVYLEPGADLLTISGYFKTFNYQQTNAQLSGTDLSAMYNWNAYLKSNFMASFLFARNVTAHDWVILMPADRLSLSTTYTRDISPGLKECYISADAKFVFHQWRIPANFDQVDFPRPPAGYFLADVSVGTTLEAGKQPLYMSLTVMNLFNQKYRDYLDAFRYFINQPGTNVVLRVRVPVSFNNKKSS